MVHPQSGDRLEDVEDQFAFAETEQHRGGRAEFHATGGQRHQVRGDAVEFHEHHPHDLRAFGDEILDAEQLLDAEAVGRLVVERGEVVHARDEGDALRPVAEFEVLLDSGVQIADSAAGLRAGLAVDLEDQAQHPVGGRVLGAHVDDDVVLTAVAYGSGDVVPVASDGVEDGLVRNAEYEAVRRAFLAQPERCRRLLAYVAAMDRPDYDNIAAALGMKRGSIGPTRGRCLNKLRTTLLADPGWSRGEERDDDAV